jgi:hypothetical protein
LLSQFVVYAFNCGSCANITLAPPAIRGRLPAARTRDQARETGAGLEMERAGASATWNLPRQTEQLSLRIMHVENKQTIVSSFTQVIDLKRAESQM